MTIIDRHNLALILSCFVIPAVSQISTTTPDFSAYCPALSTSTLLSACDQFASAFDCLDAETATDYSCVCQQTNINYGSACFTEASSCDGGAYATVIIGPLLDAYSTYCGDFEGGGITVTDSTSETDDTSATDTDDSSATDTDDTSATDTDDTSATDTDDTTTTEPNATSSMSMGSSTTSPPITSRPSPGATSSGPQSAPTTTSRNSGERLQPLLYPLVLSIVLMVVVNSL